jgi:hypothetical protein
MSDLLKQIQELQEFYDNQDKINKDILAMFDLAGYELNAEEYELEQLEGQMISSRPKTVEELVREVLDNPPTEPQKYIKISDIPRYINDYLIVPDRETLDEWNTAAPRSATLPQLPLESGTIAEIDEEPERTVNERGELDPDFLKTGPEWVKAGMVPVGTTIVDAIGVMWHKKAPNTWFDVSGDPIAAMEPYEDRDLTPMGPLEEVEER